MRLSLSTHTLVTLVFLSCSTGCRTVPVPSDTNPADPVKASNAPFKLSIVPTKSFANSRMITMAPQKPDEFYVVLSNISDEPQSIWESWNSWGYQTISFEFTLADGQRFLVSERQQNFTRNFPSPFIIPPGEHHVYAIRLDAQWTTGGITRVTRGNATPKCPPLKSDEIPVVLKAIYEVPTTPEATQYKVWSGRVESASYNLTLRQW